MISVPLTILFHFSPLLKVKEMSSLWDINIFLNIRAYPSLPLHVSATFFEEYKDLEEKKDFFFHHKSDSLKIAHFLLLLLLFWSL